MDSDLEASESKRSHSPQLPAMRRLSFSSLDSPLMPIDTVPNVTTSSHRPTPRKRPRPSRDDQDEYVPDDHMNADDIDDDDDIQPRKKSRKSSTPSSSRRSGSSTRDKAKKTMTKRTIISTSTILPTTPSSSPEGDQPQSPRKRRSSQTSRKYIATSQNFFCFCRKAFTRNNDLQRHVENVHGRYPKKWVCPICQTSLSRRDSVLRHGNGKHSKDPDWTQWEKDNQKKLKEEPINDGPGAED